MANLNSSVPGGFYLFPWRECLNTHSVTLVVAFVGLGLFAAASFFFALAETALFSLGKWQVRQLGERSPRAGTIVATLLSKPQDLLATIVLGNTFANGTIVATILWAAMEYDWPMPAILLLLFVVILFGAEVAPKTLAVREPEFWALRVARPMLALQKATGPLRHLAQQFNRLIIRAGPSKFLKTPGLVAEEDYQELVELAHQQGTLAASEKEIILQIINLDRRTAKDVMKPRSQVACISDDLSQEEMAAAARQYKHRRLPIYDETPDTIVGILNTRALLLDPHLELSEAIEFPSFVPESMNLLQLLKSLQRQRRGLAIVLDEFGGTAGIVTLEDILSEMVGDMREEGEPVGFLLEKLGEGRWLANATMRWDDFRREYPALGEAPGIETLGGLMLKELEVVPASGQSVVFRGLRFTAQSVDDRRVREILIEAIRRR